MRIASLHDRLVIVDDTRALDVERASEGLFSHRIAEVYERWAEFRSWADTARTERGFVYDPARLDSPSPAARQIVAFGLNYADHAQESGLSAPEGLPPVFTKFASSVTGPNTTVDLPSGNVDWEVELAVVIGRIAHHIGEAEAWDHVAGVTVAQDLSERVLQFSGPAPQFSLGKSHPGFLPLGPAVVSVDELPDPDALQLRAEINGETVQHGNTRDMIMPVPVLLARLSQVLTLYPGDVILTGTPAGVGMGRTPARYLAEGDVLTSSIEGVGSMRQTFRKRGLDADR
jgi:2-keto-4-pentenoate hydratase/2-oxohepta-3-ene-1,7-dioic acid hydratase in catechol pathway